MAIAGFNGYINLVTVAASPTYNWTAPGGAQVTVTDEVTRFLIDESVQMREFGHDKSAGWQDNCAGIRRAEITIEAMISDSNVGGAGGMNWYSGALAYLVLYPAGDVVDQVAAPVQGYATVRSVSYVYDQETGLPISYTCRLSSKGPWSGMDAGDVLWGGFEFL